MGSYEQYLRFAFFLADFLVGQPHDQHRPMLNAMTDGLELSDMRIGGSNVYQLGSYAGDWFVKAVIHLVRRADLLDWSFARHISPTEALTAQLFLIVG